MLERDINKVRVQTKTKIKTIVENYKMLFPDEFVLTIRQVALNRKAQRDKFASLKKGKFKADFVERALVETPETLNSMFDLRLTDDEKIEFKSKRGIRWFAKEYPMFKLAERI